MRTIICDKNISVFGLFPAILFSETVHAHGDMVIASFGITSALLQLIFIIWIFISNKTKTIKLPLLSIVIPVFLLSWLALDIAPSKKESTEILLWLVNIIPIIMLVGVNMMLNKLTCKSEWESKESM